MPDDATNDGWIQLLEEMDAMAETLAAEGWETLTIPAGDTAAVTAETGIMYSWLDGTHLGSCEHDDPVPFFPGSYAALAGGPLQLYAPPNDVVGDPVERRRHRQVLPEAGEQLARVRFGMDRAVPG